MRPPESRHAQPQGYREDSNVQVFNEMIHMVSGMRQYEAIAHSLKALSEAVQQRTRGQV